jgi:hypothetical protein
MQNPFAPSQAPGQWLRSSVGWTATCLVGACLVNQLAYSKFVVDTGAVTPATKVAVVLAFGSCCVFYGLVWWLALSGSSAVLERAKQRGGFSWATLAAEVWKGVLICLQLICLLLLLLQLLVTLLIVADPDMAPHFG